MSNFVYGLDFGTTNSAIAYVQDEVVKIIPHGESQSQTMPSVLFFPEGHRGHLVGDEALAHYADGFIEGRLIQSIKSTLTEKWLKGTTINRTWYDIEDIISLILKHLKTKADQMTGRDVRNVVLGRPAMFSADSEKEQFAKERLITAAQKAGFEEIHFQIEPIAAALFYEASLTRPELVLVADFGGGTSDFTLMRLSPDKVQHTDRHADIIGTRGLSVAGDKLDSAIMWHKLTPYFGARVKWSSWDNTEQWLDMPVHIMQAICDWRQIAFLKESRQRKRITDIRYAASTPEAIRRYGPANQTAVEWLETLIDENIGFALFRSLEAVKAMLSSESEGQIHFRQAQIQIDETITRAEFETMIAREVQAIEHCLARFLDDLNVKPAEIDSVFLTGGTAYVPRIRKLLYDTFGAAKIRQGDAFVSVVSGLALSQRLFF